MMKKILKKFEILKGIFLCKNFFLKKKGGKRGFPFSPFGAPWEKRGLGAWAKGPGPGRGPWGGGGEGGTEILGAPRARGPWRREGIRGGKIDGERGRGGPGGGGRAPRGKGGGGRGGPRGKGEKFSVGDNFFQNPSGGIGSNPGGGGKERRTKRADAF